MKTRLLARLHRAIVCINDYDSSFTFNEKLMEVKVYSQFIIGGKITLLPGKTILALKEITRIADDTLSKKTHTRGEKKQVTKQLHSFLEEME